MICLTGENVKKTVLLD